MKRGEIRIAAGVDGMQTEEWKARAEIHGHFAIHRGVRVDRLLETPTWTLTHIPTGYRLTSRPTKASVRAALRSVLALKLDWSFSDPTAAKRFSPDVRTALKQIQDGVDRIKIRRAF